MAWCFAILRTMFSSSAVLDVSAMVPVFVAGLVLTLSLIAAIGAQAWMTGTDAELFTEMGNRGQGFCVTNGALTPI